MIASKRGQMTVFIILAIVIVVGIIGYFFIHSQGVDGAIPAEFSPVYSYYEQCISQETASALDVAGTQGGYVSVPPYIPGSQYAPFSSQLDFFGFPVPYWFYLSGNGVAKEHVPRMSDIQRGLEESIAARIQECDFSAFYAQGFSIEFSPPVVKTRILDDRIVVDVDAPMSVTYNEASARKASHHVEVPSHFGSLYKEAVSVYTAEKQEAFLENYSADVLRLYAPVDGVEISCSPKVWKAREVVEGLRSALSANIGALTFLDGSARARSGNYFVVPHAVQHRVQLAYHPQWPSAIDIEGADDALLLARPIGNQAGLGILGFCYAPYHFVYDVRFPVMVQITEGDELFQFPVVVVIDKNMPRNGISGGAPQIDDTPDLCAFSPQNVTVHISDRELHPVDARVEYECLNQLCTLGTAVGGTLSASAPSCLNGNLRVRADGFADSQTLFSSSEQSATDIVLEPVYAVNVSLSVNGKTLGDNAVVSLIGPRAASVLLPDSGQASLSEGYYNITVMVYRNTSLTIPASKTTQCQDVPEAGIFGFFGKTAEQCFDITLPETKIESALVGGGSSQLYLLASDLQKGVVRFEVDGLPVPTTLEQLQSNYAAFDAHGVQFT